MMGAIFHHVLFERVFPDDPEEENQIVLHRSTGKHPYPAGQYHLPVWGPWLQDSPMWTRHCMWDFAYNGAAQGCDLVDQTSIKPEETSP